MKIVKIGNLVGKIRKGKNCSISELFKLKSYSTSYSSFFNYYINSYSNYKKEYNLHGDNLKEKEKENYLKRKYKTNPEKVLVLINTNLEELINKKGVYLLDYTKTLLNFKIKPKFTSLILDNLCYYSNYSNLYFLLKYLLKSLSLCGSFHFDGYSNSNGFSCSFKGSSEGNGDKYLVSGDNYLKLSNFGKITKKDKKSENYLNGGNNFRGDTNLNGGNNSYDDNNFNNNYKNNLNNYKNNLSNNHKNREKEKLGIKELLEIICDNFERVEKKFEILGLLYEYSIFHEDYCDLVFGYCLDCEGSHLLENNCVYLLRYFYKYKRDYCGIIISSLISNYSSIEGGDNYPHLPSPSNNYNNYYNCRNRSCNNDHKQKKDIYNNNFKSTKINYNNYREKKKNLEQLTVLIRGVLETEEKRVSGDNYVISGVNYLKNLFFLVNKNLNKKKIKILQLTELLLVLEKYPFYPYFSYFDSLDHFRILGLISESVGFIELQSLLGICSFYFLYIFDGNFLSICGDNYHHTSDNSFSSNMVNLQDTSESYVVNVKDTSENNIVIKDTSENNIVVKDTSESYVVNVKDASKNKKEKEIVKKFVNISLSKVLKDYNSLIPNFSLFFSTFPLSHPPNNFNSTINSTNNTNYTNSTNNSKDDGEKKGGNNFEDDLLVMSRKIYKLLHFSKQFLEIINLQILKEIDKFIKNFHFIQNYLITPFNQLGNNFGTNLEGNLKDIKVKGDLILFQDFLFLLNSLNSSSLDDSSFKSYFSSFSLGNPGNPENSTNNREKINEEKGKNSTNNEKSRFNVEVCKTLESLGTNPITEKPSAFYTLDIFLKF